MKYFLQYVTILASCLSFDFIQTLPSPYIYDKKDKLSIPEHLLRARTRKIAGSCRCLYFRYDENPAKRNSDGIERLGLSHGWRHSKVFFAAASDGRWTQTTHLFASVSYHQHPTGPTHFPFLESHAAHFPDVPSVPVVKCQYGTYPRTKVSLVRQHHRTTR